MIESHAVKRIVVCYIYDTNQHNPITFFQKEIISFIFSVLLLSVERLLE